VIGWPPPWSQEQARAAGVPLGHSIGAHQHLGWCFGCKGITGTAEAMGWRLLACGEPAATVEAARAWSEGQQ
jgi:hypothetical protein